MVWEHLREQSGTKMDSGSKVGNIGPLGALGSIHYGGCFLSDRISKSKNKVDDHHKRKIMLLAIIRCHHFVWTIFYFLFDVYTIAGPAGV